MTNQRIIYQTLDGGIAIIIPALGCGLTVAEIAAKDVPSGLPYKIVDAADILADRTARDSWTINAAELTDGVGE